MSREAFFHFPQTHSRNVIMPDNYCVAWLWFCQCNIPGFCSIAHQRSSNFLPAVCFLTVFQVVLRTEIQNWGRCWRLNSDQLQSLQATDSHKTNVFCESNTYITYVYVHTYIYTHIHITHTYIYIDTWSLNIWPTYSLHTISTPNRIHVTQLSFWLLLSLLITPHMMTQTCWKKSLTVVTWQSTAQ